MSDINLCGEFITHKVFGRGQISENQDGVITVLFETKEVKKFIFPSAMEQFLTLESSAAAKEYKTYADGLASEINLAKKDAADRLALEKLAIKEHAKTLKKAAKKPVKKAKVEIDYYEDTDI